MRTRRVPAPIDPVEAMALSPLHAAWHRGQAHVKPPCDRVQDAPELGDEGLDQQGMGGEHALSGGQRCGALAGLDTRGDYVDRAHVMGVEEALQGGAAREVGGCEGRPWREELAEARGIFVVKPWQGVREVVLQGTGETVGDAHLVADQAAAVCDEPFAQGGTDALDNLALACFHCNRRKADRLTATDPHGGASVLLFNPRQHMWSDHFIWSADGLIIGVSPIGRAAITALELNRERAVNIRAADVAVSRHPPSGDPMQQMERPSP